MKLKKDFTGETKALYTKGDKQQRGAQSKSNRKDDDSQRELKTKPEHCGQKRSGNVKTDPEQASHYCKDNQQFHPMYPLRQQPLFPGPLRGNPD